MYIMNIMYIMYVHKEYHVHHVCHTQCIHIYIYLQMYNVKSCICTCKHTCTCTYEAVAVFFLHPNVVCYVILQIFVYCTCTLCTHLCIQIHVPQNWSHDTQHCLWSRSVLRGWSLVAQPLSPGRSDPPLSTHQGGREGDAG